MIPAFTYDDICKELENDKWSGKSVKFVGLLFSRPESILGREEITLNLSYFHERSAQNVHFFCAGYQWEKEPDSAPTTVKIADEQWYFNQKRFIQFCDEIKSKIKWHYSGGTDLILLNTIYNFDNVELDFESETHFFLKKMKNENIIDGVAEFFEEIFEFAKNYNGNDAVGDFMNPPDIGEIRIAHSNISVLWNRAKILWLHQDYAGVLHSCASLFETMAKQIIGDLNLNHKTLGKILKIYSKHSHLKSKELNHISEIYTKRNKEHLAGHGGLNKPNVSRKEAEEIMEATCTYVRAEYSAFAA